MAGSRAPSAQVEVILDLKDLLQKAALGQALSPGYPGDQDPEQVLNRCLLNLAGLAELRARLKTGNFMCN